MFRLSVSLLILLATPAPAMNWEGKEDWLNDLPQAQEYEHELPQAKAGPLKPCRQNPRTNPYEQVEIPGKNCRPLPPPETPNR
jgi:hypothetical protein